MIHSEGSSCIFLSFSLGEPFPRVLLRLIYSIFFAAFSFPCSFKFSDIWEILDSCKLKVFFLSKFCFFDSSGKASANCCSRDFFILLSFFSIWFWRVGDVSFNFPCHGLNRESTLFSFGMLSSYSSVNFVLITRSLSFYLDFTAEFGLYGLLRGGGSDVVRSNVIKPYTGSMFCFTGS